MMDKKLLMGGRAYLGSQFEGVQFIMEEKAWEQVAPWWQRCVAETLLLAFGQQDTNSGQEGIQALNLRPTQKLGFLH